MEIAPRPKLELGERIMFNTKMASLIGELLIVSEGDAITGLYFEGEPKPEGLQFNPDLAIFALAVKQLQEYFEGDRQSFDVPIDLCGTVFQKSVWAELRKIHYGTTISYGELARRVGNPKASRAVGLANGRNPIPIIVPCHRVIGASGTLTGFGGGLHIKTALLQLEENVGRARDYFRKHPS